MVRKTITVLIFVILIAAITLLFVPICFAVQINNFQINRFDYSRQYTSSIVMTIESVDEELMEDLVIKYDYVVDNSMSETYKTTEIMSGENSFKWEQFFKFNSLYNKNPFSFTGIINRLQYVITKLVLFIMVSIPVFYKSINNQVDEMQFMILQSAVIQIVFILAFYAASKRLRDIQWNQWLLLVWAIPFIGLGVGIPLLFVKSKVK